MNSLFEKTYFRKSPLPPLLRRAQDGEQVEPFAKSPETRESLLQREERRD